MTNGTVDLDAVSKFVGFQPLWSHTTRRNEIVKSVIWRRPGQDPHVVKGGMWRDDDVTRNADDAILEERRDVRRGGDDAIGEDATDARCQRWTKLVISTLISLNCKQSERNITVLSTGNKA